MLAGIFILPRTTEKQKEVYNIELHKHTEDLPPWNMLLKCHRKNLSTF